MRKKTGIAIIAMIFVLSSCARIPGIDSLEKLSQAFEEAKEERSGEDERDPVQSSEAADRTSNVGLKGNGKVHIQSGDSGETGESSAQTESEEDESEESDSYTLGVTTDYGWESEYWNLRYTAPEGLYMLNEDGLDAVMGLSEELVSKNYTERQQEYLKLTTLYEMMSMTVTGDTNVVATVEKLYVKNMDTEAYKKAALLHLRLMQDPVYEILNDSDTVEIAGETYSVVKAKALADNPCLQDYYFRVVGNRALILTITYTEETADTAETILNGFDVY